ncbi:MAG: protein kinase domain-containing protein, partial [Polyangiales bacterium]
MQSRGNGQNGPGHAAAAGEGSGPTLAALPETLQSRFAGATWQHGDAQRATYRTELSDGQLGCLKLLVDPTAQSSTRRSRLQRALEKLTQLQHPCVAQPQEIGSHAGTLWLLRHWVDGVSAGQYLRQNGALAPADAAAVVVQIADALDALHRLGLQQRDLQPAHILLSPDRSAAPRVTLIDTGLPSYGSGAGLAASGRGRAYRAPELDGERQEDFRTDLFSLGCVLYELLSAQRLFPERGPAEALERYTDPNFAVLPAGVDPDLAALVKQLVAQDPAERPLSARQVQRALRSFLPAAVAQQLTQKGLRAMHSEPPGTSSRPPRAAQRTVLGMAAGQWLHTADSAQSEPAGALSSAPPAGAGSGAPNASKRTQMFGAVTTSTPPSSHPPAAAGGS